jgi:hypothetical protein
LAVLWPSPTLAQTCGDRSQDFEARFALCDLAYESAETEDAAATALAMKGEAQLMLGQHDLAA